MTTITYKQSPPRRPTIDDVGGGEYEDDADFPPDPGDPDADSANQLGLLAVASHGTLEHTKLYVTVPGGTPTGSAIKSLRDDLLVGDFTLTDNGAGDTSIAHTGGKLPADSFPAEAYPVGDAGDCTITVASITNGWRVKARVAGTLTDTPFVLKIYGL